MTEPCCRDRNDHEDRHGGLSGEADAVRFPQFMAGFVEVAWGSKEDRLTFSLHGRAHKDLRELCPSEPTGSFGLFAISATISVLVPGSQRNRACYPPLCCDLVAATFSVCMSTNTAFIFSSSRGFR